MFPQYNIYSTPLLILVIQGLIFAFLLIKRYLNKGNISDLLLALILIITCYHRTTYTIGFMGWYDTYQNTKINYWLIALTLAIGPLIYLYIRSVTSRFRFSRKDLLHFIPALLYVILKIFIFVFDAMQPGFADTQNGFLKSDLEFVYISPIITVIERLQFTLYLAFAIQLYVIFRKQIQQYFSDAYSLQLNWIRNFLYICTFLFLFDLFQSTINAFIVELSWTQNWWYQILSAVSIIYIGISGYFTDTSILQEMDIGFAPRSNRTINQQDPIIQKGKIKLDKIIDDHQPYLNPNLNLSELAELMQMSSSALSELINIGYGVNFNDFVNAYRIKSFKSMIDKGRHQQLSLVGIALDCGFNSKATFNRVFRRQVGMSPSEYLESQKIKTS